MFVRAKKSGAYQYLQLVRSERVDGHVRQYAFGGIASCARFAERTAVLEAHERGKTEVAETIKIGPPLLFERLWKDLGMPEVLSTLAAGSPVSVPRGAGRIPHRAAPALRPGQ